MWWLLPYRPRRTILFKEVWLQFHITGRAHFEELRFGYWHPWPILEASMTLECSTQFLIHILERPLGDKLKTILSNAFMLLQFTRWSVPEATAISAHGVLMKSVFRFIDPNIHELHEKVHITQPQFFSHSSKSFCRFVKTSTSLCNVIVQKFQLIPDLHDRY